VSHSRKAAVIANVLREYKEMLTNTTSDLEEHLQKISDILQTLFLTGTWLSDENAAEQNRVQEEWDSTKQCLTICAQASDYVDLVRRNVFKDVPAAQDAH